MESLDTAKVPRKKKRQHASQVKMNNSIKNFFFSKNENKGLLDLVPPNLSSTFRPTEEVGGSITLVDASKFENDILLSPQRSPVESTATTTASATTKSSTVSGIALNVTPCSLLASIFINCSGERKTPSSDKDKMMMTLFDPIDNYDPVAEKKSRDETVSLLANSNEEEVVDEKKEDVSRSNSDGRRLTRSRARNNYDLGTSDPCQEINRTPALKDSVGGLSVGGGGGGQSFFLSKEEKKRLKAEQEAIRLVRDTEAKARSVREKAEAMKQRIYEGMLKSRSEANRLFNEATLIHVDPLDPASFSSQDGKGTVNRMLQWSHEAASNGGPSSLLVRKDSSGLSGTGSSGGETVFARFGQMGGVSTSLMSLATTQRDRHWQSFECGDDMGSGPILFDSDPLRGRADWSTLCLWSPSRRTRPLFAPNSASFHLRSLWTQCALEHFLYGNVSHQDTSFPRSPPRSKKIVDLTCSSPSVGSGSLRSIMAGDAPSVGRGDDDRTAHPLDRLVQGCGNEEGRIEILRWMQSWQSRKSSSISKTVTTMPNTVSRSDERGSVTVLDDDESSWKEEVDEDSIEAYEASEDEYDTSVPPRRRPDPRRCSETLSNVLIVQGPSGCGKTSAVLACASVTGFKVVEVSVATARSATALKKMIAEATQSRSIEMVAETLRPHEQTPACRRRQVDMAAGSVHGTTDGTDGGWEQNNNLILLDEVDVSVGEVEDTSFCSAIQQLVKTARCPIVLTGEQVLSRKALFSKIFGKTVPPPRVIPFRRTETAVTGQFLLEHLPDIETHRPCLLDMIGQTLPALANGDFRSCLNSVQLILPSPRTTPRSVPPATQPQHRDFADWLLDVRMDFVLFDRLLESHQLIPLPSSSSTSSISSHGSIRRGRIILPRVTHFYPIVYDIQPRRLAVNSDLPIMIRGKNFLQSGDRSSSTDEAQPSWMPVTVFIDGVRCEACTVLSDTSIALHLNPDLLTGLLRSDSLRVCRVTVEMKTELMSLRSEVGGTGSSWLVLIPAAVPIADSHGADLRPALDTTKPIETKRLKKKMGRKRLLKLSRQTEDPSHESIETDGSDPGPAVLSPSEEEILDTETTRTVHRLKRRRTVVHSDDETYPSAKDPCPLPIAPRSQCTVQDHLDEQTRFIEYRMSVEGQDSIAGEMRQSVRMVTTLMTRLRDLFLQEESGSQILSAASQVWSSGQERNQDWADCIHQTLSILFDPWIAVHDPFQGLARKEGDGVWATGLDECVMRLSAVQETIEEGLYVKILPSTDPGLDVEVVEVFDLEALCHDVQEVLLLLPTDPVPIEKERRLWTEVLATVFDVSVQSATRSRSFQVISPSSSMDPPDCLGWMVSYWTGDRKEGQCVVVSLLSANSHWWKASFHSECLLDNETWQTVRKWGEKVLNPSRGAVGTESSPYDIAVKVEDLRIELDRATVRRSREMRQSSRFLWEEDHSMEDLIPDSGPEVETKAGMEYSLEQSLSIPAIVTSIHASERSTSEGLEGLDTLVASLEALSTCDVWQSGMTEEDDEACIVSQEPSESDRNDGVDSGFDGLEHCAVVKMSSSCPDSFPVGWLQRNNGMTDLIHCYQTRRVLPPTPIIPIPHTASTTTSSRPTNHPMNRDLGNMSIGSKFLRHRYRKMDLIRSSQQFLSDVIQSVPNGCSKPVRAMNASIFWNRLSRYDVSRDVALELIPFLVTVHRLETAKLSSDRCPSIPTDDLKNAVAAPTGLSSQRITRSGSKRLPVPSQGEEDHYLSPVCRKSTHLYEYLMSQIKDLSSKLLVSE